MIYNSNIETETLENSNYRKVLYTGNNMQLVVMCLQPGDDIPAEIHEDIEQFFRIEQGTAKVIIDEETFEVSDDEVFIVPAGAKHQVINAGDGELKLYTIYTPPEHPAGTVHKNQAEADAYEQEHHH
jgi:mannose-6-phosphate isomerase-like protein (cupin superfamily)